MDLQVQQNELQAALQMVTRAVSLRTTMPVLSGVMFDATVDGLRLTATDLEVTIQTVIPAQTQREGRVVLPGRYVNEIVRRIPDGPVNLLLAPESLRLTLHWGRSEYVINGLPPEQFPAVGTVGGARLAILGRSLQVMFKQTVFAVSNDETRPVLTGVHVTIDDGVARAIATDGFRVAIQTVDLKGADNAELILPGHSLQEIGRILQYNDDEVIDVRTLDNQAEFELGGTRVLSRLVAGPYPNIIELLPDDYPQRVLVSRSALGAALERAALLADERSVTRWLVVLTFASDHITITAEDPEVGQAYEEVAAELQGDSIRVGFNARYLLEGLRHIEDERLEIAFIDPDKAVRMRAAGDDSYQYIVFPIRL